MPSPSEMPTCGMFTKAVLLFQIEDWDKNPSLSLRGLKTTPDPASSIPNVMTLLNEKSLLLTAMKRNT